MEKCSNAGGESWNMIIKSMFILKFALKSFEIDILKPEKGVWKIALLKSDKSFGDEVLLAALLLFTFCSV